MATIKQKLVMKKIVENNGNISKSMREVGYSPKTAKNPKNLTQSKSWDALMGKYLSDEFVMKHHKELFDTRRVDYFMFPNSMDDDEIKKHVKAAGFDVIVVRRSEKGKMAFYSSVDANAKKAALDMALKLKGKYASDKNTEKLIEKVEEIKFEFPKQ